MRLSLSLSVSFCLPRPPLCLGVSVSMGESVDCMSLRVSVDRVEGWRRWPTVSCSAEDRFQRSHLCRFASVPFEWCVGAHVVKSACVRALARVSLCNSRARVCACMFTFASTCPCVYPFLYVHVFGRARVCVCPRVCVSPGAPLREVVEL